MTIEAKELEQLTDWEHGLISARIFSDQEIFDQEMRDVFGRAWLFLADDSMIPKPGDFFSTYMGTDPVLVVRQRDGSVKAMLNACRHRGMRVCRADMGNIKAFTCTYHGWTYDTAGNLANVPNFEDGYFSELPVDKWGLIQVAEVENYKGLIFGNFDPTAPSLLDYLGDMAWYLDGFLDKREGGIEVVGSVHKMLFKGNWKFAAEQFAGDHYHAPVTHASAFTAWAMDKSIARPQPVEHVEKARQFSSRNGHAVSHFQIESREFQAARLRARGEPELAEYFEQALPEINQRLGPDRPIGSAATVFPNLSYLNGHNSLGIWHPKSPNTFEEWRWAVVDKAASPEEKALQARAHQVWPLAVADADDGENWSMIAANFASHSPQVQKLMLNYQLGVGHERDDDPVYNGRIGYSTVNEGAHRGFYRRWLEFMTAGDKWPILETDERLVSQIGR